MRQAKALGGGGDECSCHTLSLQAVSRGYMANLAASAHAHAEGGPHEMCCALALPVALFASCYSV